MARRPMEEGKRCTVRPSSNVSCRHKSLTALQTLRGPKALEAELLLDDGFYLTLGSLR